MEGRCPHCEFGYNKCESSGKAQFGINPQSTIFTEACLDKENCGYCNGCLFVEDENLIDGVPRPNHILHELEPCLECNGETEWKRI